MNSFSSVGELSSKLSSVYFWAKLETLSLFSIRQDDFDIDVWAFFSFLYQVY